MGMNDLNLGFGLGEKMGLSPTQVNTAATGMETYQQVANGVMQIGSIWSNYYNAKFSSDMQRIGAQLTRQSASSYLDDAREATRMAGRVQQTGVDSATNRYLQLAQDVGHIYAGAAGSGIDVSSATVRHVDRSARLMAQRDVSAINRSTAEAARQFTRQASAYQRSYGSTLVKANLADIQADYARRAARTQAQFGTFSAASSNLATIAALILV